MNLKFRDDLVIGGSGEWDYKPFRFNVRKINIGKAEPSWKDVILSGVSPLTLTNIKADGLNYLKLFGGTKQRNLPSEYTQVEYLESSGTQYIDTGVTLKSNSKIKLIVIDFNVGSAFGVNTLNGQYTIAASASGMFYRLFSVDGVRIGLTEGKHTCSFLGNKGFYDGSLVYTGGTPTDSTLSLYLFARNIDGSATNFGTGKISLFEIDNHKFIPCRRNSDSVLGMYDTVTGTFLTNAGTGTFTAGADVTTPSLDAPMDIWCNNGVIKYSTNLFDGQWQVGIYSPSTGEYSTLNNRICNVNIMKVSPSTNYTVSFPDFTIGGNFRWVFYKSDKTFASAITNGNTTITTPANAEYLNVYIATDLTTAQAPQMQIEKGDIATAYHSHVEGIYTDGTQETVTVTGKNLFDKSTITTGRMIKDDGTFQSNPLLGTSDYINIKNATNITVNVDSKNINSGAVCFFDANKTYISGSAFSYQNIKTLSVPANAVYIITTFVLAQLDSTQVELGSTATDCEPYFNGGSATAEMLLKVGDYKDIQSILDGGVTRNVGIKVFDGTEVWATSGTTFVTNITDSNPNLSYQKLLYCTHYPALNNVTETFGVNMTVYSSGDYASLYLKGSGFSTSSELNSWLAQQYNAGTPMILVYPLATATTETVTPQPLSVQAGTNIVTITQASIDNLTLEVSYKAAAQVTITEVQNSQLSNNVEVTIND